MPFGVHFDIVGKSLNSGFGMTLFISMSAIAFFAGQFSLRNHIAILKQDLGGSSFLQIV
jgi:hypothetical protein